MKLHLPVRVWVFLLLLMSSACRNIQSGSEANTPIVAEHNEQVALPTTIYLVRHAEKDISDPSEQDPDLTAAGEARAESLRLLLEGKKIDALYTTKYKRTRNTLAPLAHARNLAVTEYEAHDFIGLEKSITQNHAGGTIVVVGHSNTLLPIMEALGAKRPVTYISESQYDYLFKVTVAQDGTTTIITENFGVTTE
jgi:2,3-bisphosphoglycerate-dependent phosphoglycerate mutase